MAAGETKVLPKSHSMNGGDGPFSYARNSSFQKIAVDGAQKMINEAIADNLDIGNPCLESSIKFQIADLGCSVGPNTFFAVQNIIEAVEKKYKTKHQNSPTLEFQVFFNDTTSNDFNQLFRSLPPLRQYFSAGVPGSFYGRLFPKATINFVHSSSSLNWLSKIPKEVTDSNSLAWNKGSIYCTGTENEVAEAFSAQYKRDIENFLSARAEEIVGGGLMVIYFGGLPNEVTLSQTVIGKTYEILGSCLIDMAKKGLISEEKVESFNLPLYFPSIKEWEALIERNEYFTIERFDVPSKGDDMLRINTQKWTSNVRAVMEGLIKNHFGNEIVEELFESFANKYENIRFMADQIKGTIGMLFTVLKRKIN